MSEETKQKAGFFEKWGVLFLKGVAKIFVVMPLTSVLAVGQGFGFLFGSTIRYHRKEALDALQKSLPELTDKEHRQIIWKMYQNLGMNLAESLRLAGGKTDQVDMMIEMHGLEHVDKALEGGKGALMLTAHYGNWDLLSVMTPKIGYPLMIISKDVKNAALNDFWMNMRRRYGLEIVPAHNSYRACRAALRKNHLVGFILDQNMIDKEGVFVDFFGRSACTTPGLAFMSAQAKAPVVPVFIHRRADGKHEGHCLPMMEPPADREEETMRVATQQYTKIIEDVIRAEPDQWIWIHKRWRTQPKPEGWVPPEE